MEVVGHQAVSQQSHVMAFHHLREDALECRIILAGLEDSQPGVGPIQGVVDEATFPPLVVALACPENTG